MLLVCLWASLPRGSLGSLDDASERLQVRGRRRVAQLRRRRRALEVADAVVELPACLPFTLEQLAQLLKLAHLAAPPRLCARSGKVLAQEFERVARPRIDE